MVDTRTETNTSPYTAEQDAKAVAILKERRKKKEAKKKALLKEQTAKKKKVEEEMAKELERLTKEEEEKLRAVEAEEDPLEKKITERVANLSLGEEEALMYVTREKQKAAMKEWDAEEVPLKRQTIENEKSMELKLRLMRERKKRVKAVSQAARELEEVKKQREHMEVQADLLGNMQVMAHRAPSPDRKSNISLVGVRT
ncbi:hypothetical protein CBR_g11883 [Chara braunii]|uniref:Uncharacterized protein n=1 Tax=Chara braunii TaxID=69332 RepID=A0A388JS75_CHABU|nr:hypothetical protein CBR_g11883 [Chara braunii]|eukprot:GBG60658.1 hypothetical protein CBR_g11883 [Chara braunii]